MATIQLRRSTVLRRSAMIATLACFGQAVVAAPPTTRSAPPPSSRRTTTQPTAQLAPSTAAPQAAKPRTSFDPPPLPVNGRVPVQPPQPQREDDVAAPAKPETLAKPAASVEPQRLPQIAEPKPAVTAEVKAPTVKAPTVDVKPDAAGKYVLRYHFSDGETVRWQVEHRAKIVTSVQGTTQTAETVTISTKAWRVVETRPGGETKFIHMVEAINMRQKLTGRQETSYDSSVDKDVPPIFADAAKQVGVPLAEITMDVRGHVLSRADKTPRPEGSPTNTITLVLPDVPLAIGESWTSPLDLSATDSEGRPKTIKARHKLTLEKVENGLATIRNETQILSPLTDPTIEAQVVQAEQSGYVTFDLHRGRIVEQSSDLDKTVFGFQGPESKLHYTAQFRETLGDAAAKTAAESTEGNPLR